MKRTLRLRAEHLYELPTAELTSVRGGSTPFVTDGHHCHGSSLCGVVPTLPYTVTCPPITVGC